MEPGTYETELRRQIGSALLLMPAVAAAVRDAAGRLLLVREHSRDEWTIPLGPIQPGESPAEAVVRMVRALAGVDVVPSSLAAVLGGEGSGPGNYRFTRAGGHQVEYTIIVLNCSASDRSLSVLKPGSENVRFCDGETLRGVLSGCPDSIPAAVLIEAGIEADAIQPFFHWDNAWVGELVDLHSNDDSE